MVSHILIASSLSRDVIAPNTWETMNVGHALRLFESDVSFGLRFLADQSCVPDWVWGAPLCDNCVVSVPSVPSLVWPNVISKSYYGHIQI